MYSAKPTHCSQIIVLRCAGIDRDRDRDREREIVEGLVVEGLVVEGLVELAAGGKTCWKADATMEGCHRKCMYCSLLIHTNSLSAELR